MRRDQLEHIIRAAGAIAGVEKLVIVGSQAILGKYPRPTSSALTRSIEADLYPLERPELAEVIDGAIGHDSSFHTTFGYYADGVGPETAILPEGWQDRLVPILNKNTSGVTGLCLEPHDLAASKLAAGREKDLEFVLAMASCGYVDLSILHARVSALPLGPERLGLVSARVEYLTTRRGITPSHGESQSFEP